MKKQYDRHGQEIRPGMVLTDEDGIHYYVFASQTLYVMPARCSERLNRAVARQISQGNECLEFYRLDSLNLTKWSIEKES